MYSCILHGWNSHDGPCPTCQSERTITSTVTDFTITSESPSGANVLVEALEQAIEVIKGWHNMGSPGSRLTKEQTNLAWDIYYKHAPEMKPIRDALVQYNAPSPQTPIDREPEEKGTVIGTIAYNPASGDLRVTPDREPEGEWTKKEIADFLKWCSHLAWFDNDTQLWNTYDESLDPFRYSTDEMMSEYISCDKDSEKFENKHSRK